jgi:flagellar protein FliO/FliZ
MLVLACPLSATAAPPPDNAAGPPDNVAGPPDNAAGPSAAPVVRREVSNPYSGKSVGEIREVENETTSGKEDAESPLVPGAGAMVRMLLWLGLIVVLIYGGVYAFRRYVPTARNMFGGGAMKIIGRTYLGPKTCILLVKVGSRLVLVGVTPGGMSMLTEITEPHEVTAVTNEMASGAGPTGAAFDRALDRRQEEIAAREFADATEATGAADAEVRDMRDELENITEKMNWWRKTATG